MGAHHNRRLSHAGGAAAQRNVCAATLALRNLDSPVGALTIRSGARIVVRLCPDASVHRNALQPFRQNRRSAPSSLCDHVNLGPSMKSELHPVCSTAAC